MDKFVPATPPGEPRLNEGQRQELEAATACFTHVALRMFSSGTSQQVVCNALLSTFYNLYEHHQGHEEAVACLRRAADAMARRRAN